MTVLTAPVRRKPTKTVDGRFWEKVRKSENPNGCWEWTGSRVYDGYGHLHISGKKTAEKAHRWAYQRFVGPIPDGLVLDHLCRNRGCVNPAHLELTTIKTNILRGKGLAAINAQKTICERGHLLERNKTQRICTICYREYKHEWYEQNKERIREHKRQYAREWYRKSNERAQEQRATKREQS